METWIGRGAVNAGSLTDEWLFKGIYDALDKRRHGYKSGKAHYCGFDGYWTRITTNNVLNCYISEDSNGIRTVEGDTVRVIRDHLDIWAEGKWANDDIRKILINVAAKTLCFAGKFCNIGDGVRINRLPWNNEPNYLWVTIKSESETLKTDFRCCPSKHKVTENLAALASDVWYAYGGNALTTDVRCLITGTRTCEECGSSCDICKVSPCG
ncbi:hypothetical protein EK21DRAFT_95016 [Setomelanomma holmii]|uniref:Uncharacterized protein n=1 Tax=Setomelanomma holmii TaxID=210430 RepID=A0A9P4GWS8_9PLEO|nr:hypothetical protein EK21DRAFT_95016 [Setomelanomma holmii]